VVDSKAQATVLRPELERLVFGDPKEEVRTKAATALARLGCRESAPVLRQALRGSEPTRRGIAYALTQLGSDEDLPVLLPLLQSHSVQTRALMAEEISRMKLVNTALVQECLVPLLEDPAAEVRLAATLALAGYKNASSVPAARALLKGNEIPVDKSHDLIRALGSMATDAAIGVLNEMLLTDYRVRTELLRLAHPSTAYAFGTYTFAGRSLVISRSLPPCRATLNPCASSKS
jgi:HEAT repeat protein